MFAFFWKNVKFTVGVEKILNNHEEKPGIEYK